MSEVSLAAGLFETKLKMKVNLTVKFKFKKGKMDLRFKQFFTLQIRSNQKDSHQTITQVIDWI